MTKYLRNCRNQTLDIITDFNRGSNFNNRNNDTL